MTDDSSWERLLSLRVVPYDKTSREHRLHAWNALRSTVETVSRVHGASHGRKSHFDNMRLLNEGDPNDPDILLELYFAKWDVCEPKKHATEQREICLGASVGWYTYHFDEEGKLQRVHYLEDMALPKENTRELLRLKPKSITKFPKDSLAGCLYKISLENMHRRDGIQCRYGEIAPDNTAMRRQLDGNGANMGTASNSAVLEYDSFPDGALKFLDREDVEVCPIIWNGVESKRSFYVRWKDGPHDIRFMVTKGRATAVGEARADIRPWCNGPLPDAKTLERVVSGAVQAIQEEVAQRRWSRSPEMGSPALPLFETNGALMKAMFPGAANEIAIPVEYRPKSFDPPLSSVHIHIIGNMKMIRAFRGAKKRSFGGKLMVPGRNEVTTFTTHAVLQK